MDKAVQVRATMLGRSGDFLRAYPLGDPQVEGIVAEFLKKEARLGMLVFQKEEGDLEASIQAGVKAEARRKLTEEPFRHLAGIALALEADRPEVARVLKQSVFNVGARTFLARARIIEAAVAEHHDLLRSRGMADGIGEEIKTLLGQFEAAGSGANAGRRAHTGARAELKSLCKELMKMARQLDGIVKYHFRGNEEVLTAWKSARNVAWPAPEVPGPAIPPVTQGNQASR
jgi:hypothetical protein